MKDSGLFLIAAAMALIFVPLFVGKQNDVVPVEFQETVEPIRRATIQRADAVKLAAFYRSFAAVVEKDVEKRLHRATDVRTLNERSGKYCFDIKGKYPGLADDIDRVLAQGIGAKHTTDGWEDVLLTDTNRKNLATALRSIAVALER